MLRSRTDFIVHHCSASPPHVDVGVREIRQWHIQRGYSDIGYHWVIRRNGAVERGRAENVVGAHVRGWNHNSVGICMVGGTDAKGKPQDNFTAAQWATLKRLTAEVASRYPQAKVIGHRDFPRVRKACPCYDAIAWAKREGFRPAARKPAMASMLKTIQFERENDDERDDDEITQGPATPTAGGVERKPMLRSRHFWRDVTGGTLLGSGVLTSFTYGMDAKALAILLAFISVWAAFFIWMFRKDIWPNRYKDKC